VRSERAGVVAKVHAIDRDLATPDHSPATERADAGPRFFAVSSEPGGVAKKTMPRVAS
jgi:hypothetical protein